MSAPGKKQKPSLDATIRVPKAMDREIETEACRLDVFKYEVVELAWDAYQSRRLGPQRLSGAATPYDAAVLEGIRSLFAAKRTPEIEAIVTLLKGLAKRAGPAPAKRSAS